jgi:acetyl-CoA acetyltransferase
LLSATASSATLPPSAAGLSVLAVSKPPIHAQIAFIKHVASEMEREDHKLVLVILCIGGGQGIAMLLDRG